MTTSETMPVTPPAVDRADGSLVCEVIVCTTCRFPDPHPATELAENSLPVAGEQFAQLLETALAETPSLADASVRLRPMRCLMACKKPCAVTIRSADRMAYVLGGFLPSAEAAEAVVAYLQAYMATNDGIVPFRQWPQEVKGHFIARMPPVLDLESNAASAAG